MTPRPDGPRLDIIEARLNTIDVRLGNIEHLLRAAKREPVERLTYTFDEVAEALGVSRRTVNYLVAKGRLATFTIGTRRTVTREALIAYVRASPASRGQTLDA